MFGGKFLFQRAQIIMLHRCFGLRINIYQFFLFESSPNNYTVSFILFSIFQVETAETTKQYQTRIKEYLNAYNLVLLPQKSLLCTLTTRNPIPNSYADATKKTKYEQRTIDISLPLF